MLLLEDLAGLPGIGVNDVLGEEFGGHFRALLVDNLELELLHYFLEAVECLGLDVTQFFR